MKRKLLILLCLSCNALYANLLYQITGNNTQGKSYIFATNRIASIQFLDSVPNLFKCYGNCDKVITEMQLGNYELLSALQQAALLPDSVKLNAYYSVDEYNRIREAIELTLDIKMQKLARMKPAYITSLYRDALLTKWLNYDPNISSENFFQAVAKQTGKEVVALDEIGEALYILFDREPFEWQTKELLKIVDYPEREVKLEKTIYEEYHNGRINEISYLLQMPDNESTISYSDYQVFAQRNQVWVKRLGELLAENKCFICLDAVYLGGEKGLIEQLRKAGYKIKPVNK